MNFPSVIVEFGTLPRWPSASFLGSLGVARLLSLLSLPSLPSVSPSSPLPLSLRPPPLLSSSPLLSLLSLLSRLSLLSLPLSGALWLRLFPPFPLALGGSGPVPSLGFRCSGPHRR